MITSFKCEETKKIFVGRKSRVFPPDIQTRARRKLIQIHNYQTVGDLRIPPSNRLERLAGDLDGYWSIRVNKQWRIVFRWEEGSAYEVNINDYH